MTTFMDLLRSRRSVRAYDGRLVEREKLEELAEALRLAPSASNQQPWRLVFVDEPDLKDKVAMAARGPSAGFNKFAPQAPVIAVIVVERPRALNVLGAALKRRDYPLIDIGIAAAQLCLRAQELGLGTCMLGWFDEAAVRRLLGIPRSRRIGLLVTIGYPAPGLPPRTIVRKGLDQVRSYNAYE